MDKFEEEKIKSLEVSIAELKRENAMLKASVEEYKSKEQTISSAIIASMEHANQLEASRKKLYALDIQRSRLMFLRMEQTMNELYAKYPELRKDNSLKELTNKFRTMVYNDLNDKNKDAIAVDVKHQPVIDDPIKKLLHNIINCFDTKKVDAENLAKSKKVETQEDKFDINEALHPTMALDEIMKSFNINTNKNGNK